MNPIYYLRLRNNKISEVVEALGKLKSLNGDMLIDIGIYRTPEPAEEEEKEEKEKRITFTWL